MSSTVWPNCADVLLRIYSLTLLLLYVLRCSVVKSEKIVYLSCFYGLLTLPLLGSQMLII